MATRAARSWLSALLVGAWVVGVTTAMAAGQANPKIAARDQLSVTMIGVPQFTNKYPVGVDGTIEFPEIGRVPVAGLTAAEAAVLLAKRLKDGNIVLNPQVTVELYQTPNKKVSVSGFVRTQG